MNINEAAKQAIKENKCITVPEIYGVAKINLTNDENSCILVAVDGTVLTKSWKPSAKDLIREDWIVVD